MNQKKNHMIISLDSDKAIPILLHAKSMRGIRETSPIKKHSRSHGQQAGNEHQANIKKIKAIPLK